MPGGKGCRERQSERFRLRKNQETMAKIRAEAFKRLFGIDVPYEGRTEDEVEDLGRAMAKASMNGEPFSVETVACDLYQSDQVLAEACVDEGLLSNASNVDVAEVELHYHQVIRDGDDVEITVQCAVSMIDEVTGMQYQSLEHSQCNSDECVTDDVIRCGGLDGIERHYDHSRHRVMQSNTVVYNRCRMDCTCAALSRRQRARRVGLTKATCERYATRTPCACVNSCQYAEDVNNDYRRTRERLIGFKPDRSAPDLNQGVAIYDKVPPEIQMMIDSYLGCRERFLLMLRDGRTRKGCGSSIKLAPIAYPFSFRQIGCGKTITKCVCQSVAYRFGVPPNLVTALRVTSRSRMHLRCQFRADLQRSQCKHVHRVCDSPP